ncbi:hypothetical protein Bbelb_117830 [Branchiostoma belcheri]|nr:hypothetical protein Bbelb_117830 [Branchiostoma belcheri]
MAESFDPDTLSQDTTVEDVNGKKLPALDIFAHAIRYLKDHMLEAIKLKVSSNVTLHDNGIRWVLTVPAIWDDSVRQFMTQAAYKAGIASHTNEGQLLIMTEPEATEMFCRYGATQTKLVDIKPGDRYMILDCGERTVDITVYEFGEDCKVKEVTTASGGDWGGTKVDEEFLKLLDAIFGADIMAQYKVEHPNEYLNLLDEIKIRKRSALCEDSGAVIVHLLYNFYQFYPEHTGGPARKSKYTYGTGVCSHCEKPYPPPQKKRPVEPTNDVEISLRQENAALRKTLQQEQTETEKIKLKTAKIAKNFTQIESKEWVEAKEALDERFEDDRTNIQFLLDILECACQRARKVFDRFLSSEACRLHSPITSTTNTLPTEQTGGNRLDIPGSIQKEIMAFLRGTCGECDIESLIEDAVAGMNEKHGEDIATALQDTRVRSFVQACCRLAWQMAVQQPPLTTLTSNTHYDDRCHQLWYNSPPPSKSEGVSTGEIDFYIWPELRHSGTVLQKGRVCLKPIVSTT